MAAGRRKLAPFCQHFGEKWTRYIAVAALCERLNQQAVGQHVVEAVSSDFAREQAQFATQLVEDKLTTAALLVFLYGLLLRLVMVSLILWQRRPALGANL